MFFPQNQLFLVKDFYFLMCIYPCLTCRGGLAEKWDVGPVWKMGKSKREDERRKKN